MIDEPLEELAALHALGLLEGEELASFPTKMGRDPELARLVDELREAGAQLAYTAHSPSPPRELKERLLEKVDTALRFRAEQHQPRKLAAPAWLPWIVAAVLAVGGAWTGQLYLVSRSESAMLRDQKILAEYELTSARNQLRAERLVIHHEVATATDQAGAVQRKLEAAEAQAGQAGLQLTAAQKLIAARDLQLAMANDRSAALEAQAKHDADLANFQIVTLGSLLGSSPQALGIAVWNPARQEGILKVEKLPALAADQDYQLWLSDPHAPAPVDGGVFSIDPETGGARIIFKTDKPIRSIARFAVSVEKKGGAPAAEGLMVLQSK
ncbi:MAG: hypothetical protein JWM88_541 [Verrucomicrobia bacterium]|nr:hypothetical protein [Verrucomicrobiota bacterium]